jgi:hypothetical protein
VAEGDAAVAEGNPPKGCDAPLQFHPPAKAPPGLAQFPDSARGRPRAGEGGAAAQVEQKLSHLRDPDRVVSAGEGEAGMIKLFAHIEHFFLSRMLNTPDYDIVFRCKSHRAKMLLEYVIEREFAQLGMNFPNVDRSVRGNAGICHGIKFELTT